MSSLVRSSGTQLIAVGGLVYFCVLVFLLVFAHVSPVIVLALTLGTAALLLIALRPYLGLHAFIMLLFVEGAFPSREGVTAMKLIGGLIFCGWLLGSAVSRKSPIRFDAPTVVMLLFLAWCAVALVYAMDTSIGIMRTLTFAQLAAASLMFASVMEDPAMLRGVFLSIVIWSLVATCVAITGFYLGMTPMAVGLTGNRNLLATYINVGIVCAYFLSQSTRRHNVQLMLLATLAVLFFGLALTLSRTGMIVFSVSLLLAWYRVSREKKFGVLVGSALTLCLVALLLPGAFYERLQSIVPAIERQQETFGIRVRLWQAGTRMIEDRPVMGVGPGNFAVAVRRYSRGEILLAGLSAHNTYIGVAAETGLVGLAIFGLLQWTALRQVRGAIHAGWDPRNRDLAVMAEVSLVVMLLSGISGSVENLKMFWLLIGTCISLGRMVPAYVVKSEASALSRDSEGARTLAHEG